MVGSALRRGWLVPVVLAAVWLALGATPAALADPVDDLRKEIEAIKREQAAMRRELAEIKELLRTRGASAQPGGTLNDVRVAVQGAPALGPETAAVTIVEFSDYQCPFCGRHSANVLPQIVKDYVKSGKVRYVFRDFPIASIHPQAQRLHEAAHCAGDQGKYWQMHDRIFEDPQRTDTKDLVARAVALGLDGPRFEQCLAAGVHAARVRQGVADGEKARVRGTPTFFIGRTERNAAPIQPQRLVVGAQPYDAFKQAVDGVLTEKP